MSPLGTPRTGQLGGLEQVGWGPLVEASDPRREQGIGTRGPGWQTVPQSEMLGLVREGRTVEAKERPQACRSSSSE